MDQKIFFKQMIDFNQAAFNNSYQALIVLQEQFEKITETCLAQATWLPEEGKKAIEEWANAYKSGRDQYKTTMDEAYEKVQKYFSE